MAWINRETMPIMRRAATSSGLASRTMEGTSRGTNAMREVRMSTVPPMSSSAKGWSLVLNLILVGDRGVGKTNMFVGFGEPRFNWDLQIQRCTRHFIAQDFNEGEPVDIEAVLWDANNIEKIKEQGFLNSFYEDSHGALLVYDVTKPETFNNIPKWLEEIRRYAHNKSYYVIMLVGNKIDLQGHRAVTTKQGQDFANKEHLMFVEVSTATYTNTDTAFENILVEILTRIKNFEQNQQRDIGASVGASASTSATASASVTTSTITSASTSTSATASASVTAITRDSLNKSAPDAKKKTPKCKPDCRIL